MRLFHSALNRLLKSNPIPQQTDTSPLPQRSSETRITQIVTGAETELSALSDQLERDHLRYARSLNKGGGFY